jgi:hypothetical protein
MSIRSTLVDGFYEITLGSRPYKVKALIDEAAQAQFEKVLYQRYLAELMESRPALTEERYTFELEKLRANRRNGFFALKSAAGLEFFNSIPGYETLLRILIPDYQGPDILDGVVGNIEEVRELLSVITADSWPEAIKKKQDAGTEDGAKKKNPSDRPGPKKS